MNSNNPELTSQHALYLRLFFKHHQLSQQHAQLLTVTSTGLTVLHTFISQFASTLPSHSKLSINHRRDAFTTDADVSANIEEIYCLLKDLFDEWPQDKDFTNHQSSEVKPSEYTTVGSCSDQELYEMVGEYREEVRRHKQARSQADHTISELRKQLGQSQRREKRLQAEVKEKDVEKVKKAKLVEQAQQQLQEANKRLVELAGQVDELKESLEQSILIQSQLDTLSQQHQLLQQQQCQSQTELQECRQQLATTHETIRERMEEGESRWRTLIDQQLSSNLPNLLQRPICRLLGSLVRQGSLSDELC